MKPCYVIAVMTTILAAAGCAQTPGRTSATLPAAQISAKKPAPAARAAVPAPAAAQRVVVWDGEQAKIATSWAHAAASLKAQTAEAHSGDTAVEFRFKNDGAGPWVGAGWNWCAFQTGPYGTDITGMNTFTFWIKKKGTMADFQINLLCNGKVFDMPEHHTEKVSVKTYCPQLDDGQWHEVAIPLSDLKQPEGFDPLHVGELQMFCAGAGDGSIFIDDIAFENRPGAK